MSANAEDLKSFAAARCMDIFNEIQETEAKRFLQPSIYEAWKVGRDLAGYGEDKPKYDLAYIDQKITSAAPRWNGVNPDEWLEELRGKQ